MATIETYTVEDRNGNELAGPWDQFQVEEARQYAIGVKGRLIAQVYTFSDSELVNDYSEPSEEDGRGKP